MKSHAKCALELQHRKKEIIKMHMKNEIKNSHKRARTRWSFSSQKYIVQPVHTGSLPSIWGSRQSTQGSIIDSRFLLRY